MSEEDKKKEQEVIKLKRVNDLWVCTINGQEYGFRKWTWGEKNTLSSRCMRTDPMSGVPQFDSAEFNMQLLLSTLKLAPFQVTREELTRHPDAILVDKLLQITQKLNILGQVEIQNL